MGEDLEQLIRLVTTKYPLVQIAQRGQWWYVTVWVDCQERTEMAVGLTTALNRLLNRR